MLLVSWRVWHARNEATHDKPLPTIASSTNFLLSYFKLMHDVNNFPTEIILKGKQPAIASVDPVPAPRCAPIAPWCKPPVGFVKLSVDGSFKDGSAGSGTILRDEGGSIIFSSCKYIAPCTEPLEAELLACLDGLSLALERSALPIIIDTDCSQLVSLVLAKGIDRSPYHSLVSEIKFLASSGRACSFVKVDRGQVRVSHVLANFARTERRTVTWLGSGPDVALRELELESLVNPIFVQ
jgi:ribonuclease HI